MTVEHELAGCTVAVTDDADAAVRAALREAGAVVGDADRDVLVAGRADAAIGRPDDCATSNTTVVIRPTDGAWSRSGSTVSARSLDIANAVMTALAALPRAPWPADVRLAAPPGLTVAVPAGCDAAARRRLEGAGARIVDRPTDDLPEGADAAVAPTGVGSPGACSVTVPCGPGSLTVVARAFDDAVALDVAALVADVEAPQRVWTLAAAEHVELVVFGAHLRGGALTHQLTDLGARWAGEITTSARYRMTLLPTTPPKPAVTRVPDGAAGTSLQAHRWLLSPAALGRFLVALPAPMQLGKVEFSDGTWRTSFGCDGVAADAGDDISRYGGWAAATAAGAVD